MTSFQTYQNFGFDPRINKELRSLIDFKIFASIKLLIIKHYKKKLEWVLSVSSFTCSVNWCRLLDKCELIVYTRLRQLYRFFKKNLEESSSLNYCTDLRGRYKLSQQHNLILTTFFFNIKGISTSKDIKLHGLLVMAAFYEIAAVP